MIIAEETKKYFAKIGYRHGAETLNNAVACVQLLLQDYDNDVELILSELYPKEEFNDSQREKKSKEKSQKSSEESR